MRDDATISTYVDDNTATISITPGTDTSEVTMTPYRERLNQGVYGGAGATKTASTTENGAFACDDCDRTFNTEHALKIHRTKTHTPLEPVPDEADDVVA